MRNLLLKPKPSCRDQKPGLQFSILVLVTPESVEYFPMRKEDERVV